MSCKADLIPWLQLMNQLSIVSVDMTVVDRQIPQTPVSQLVRIVPLHRHTRILAGVLPPQFENTFLRFSKSKNATFYVFLKCRQKK